MGELGTLGHPRQCRCDNEADDGNASCRPAPAPQTVVRCLTGSRHSIWRGVEAPGRSRERPAFIAPPSSTSRCQSPQAVGRGYWRLKPCSPAWVVIGCRRRRLRVEDHQSRYRVAKVAVRRVALGFETGFRGRWPHYRPQERCRTSRGRRHQGVPEVWCQPRHETFCRVPPRCNAGDFIAPWQHQPGPRFRERSNDCATRVYSPGHGKPGVRSDSGSGGGETTS
jgi:hypothetical protein